MAGLKLLVDAIDMIVTAPYRVEIAPLHAVINPISDDAIKRWCCVKACQVPSLITYLTKPPFEQRTMEVLEKFSRVTGFSKALGETSSQILPQLLAGARRENNEGCMTRICCRILGAHSLQTGHPADLPVLLEKLMSAINKFPSVDLLHRLREIVAMQSPKIFEIVEKDVLEEFVNTCKRLNKENTSDSHEAAIVSINIGSAISSDMFYDIPGWSQRRVCIDQRSNAVGNWGETMLGYLVGPKAIKFMYLMVARVMFFTSSNQSIPMLTRSRTLDTVYETLQRVQYCIKEFSDDNSGAIEKVWRNTAGEELDFDTRFSAFAVAYKITPAGAYADNVERVLSQLMRVIVSEAGPCSICFDKSAAFKARQLTDALCFLLQDDRKDCLLMLRQLMDFIFGQCLVFERLGRESTQFLKSSAALVLLDALSESMKETRNEHIFPILLQILASGEVADNQVRWIESLTSTCLEPVLEVHCRGNLICDRELFKLSDQLRHKLIILLLQGACTTSSFLGLEDFSVLQNRALSYNTQVSFKKCRYPTGIENSTFIAPPSLLPRAEGDWRQQIVDIMYDIQRKSTTAVLGQVDAVCHEFEARCMTVEGPLRQAESHAARLQDELSRTKARLHQQEATNTVLMDTLKNDRVTMDGQDIKVHQLNEQVLELTSSVQEQNDKIAQLMTDITSLKLEHNSKITDLRTEAAATEKNLETINKAERVAREEQVAAAKEIAEKLGATIAWLEEEKRELEERVQSAEEKEKKVLAAIRGQEQE